MKFAVCCSKWVLNWLGDILKCPAVPFEFRELERFRATQKALGLNAGWTGALAVQALVSRGSLTASGVGCRGQWCHRVGLWHAHLRAHGKRAVVLGRGWREVTQRGLD